ncbi:MAG TPA: hypothetical protein VM095_06605 [Pyrinomonadaceae bacterium]|nr:hypothetical protein [Pyrinomonadaceae bacterium]
MPNDNHNEVNRPPSVKGKRQNPQAGQENKMSTRSKVAQAERDHPEENYGTVAEEEGQSQAIAQPKEHAKRQRAGR